MPEVYKHLDEALPPLLVEAIAKAKAGLISPEQFLDLSSKNMASAEFKE